MPAPIMKIRRFLEGCPELEENVELVLYSVNVAGRRVPVWKSHGKWTIDDIAPIIAQSSQEAANSLGATSRFALLAFAANDEDRSTAIMNMSWAVSPDMKEEELPEEEPSERASDSDLIAQLTRHNIELLQLLAKR